MITAPKPKKHKTIRDKDDSDNFFDRILNEQKPSYEHRNTISDTDPLINRANSTYIPGKNTLTKNELIKQNKDKNFFIEQYS